MDTSIHFRPLGHFGMSSWYPYKPGFQCTIKNCTGKCFMLDNYAGAFLISLETVTRTFRVKRLRTIPPGFKVTGGGDGVKGLEGKGSSSFWN